MAYFIDHNRKRIHWKGFAGDKCGFIDTPVDQREFTDSPDYIDELLSDGAYKRCPHCRSVQMLT